MTFWYRSGCRSGSVPLSNESPNPDVDPECPKTTYPVDPCFTDFLKFLPLARAFIGRRPVFLFHYRRWDIISRPKTRPGVNQVFLFPTPKKLLMKNIFQILSQPHLLGPSLAYHTCMHSAYVGMLLCTRIILVCTRLSFCEAGNCEGIKKVHS